MESTIKNYVELGVGGLKREYLSPSERSMTVGFILDNSTLKVSNKNLSISSASLLGIGKEQAEKELPIIYPFVTFFWGQLELDDAGYAGLPAREWQYLSHEDLQQMERVILAQYDPMFSDRAGEMVAIVNKTVESFHILKDVEDTTGLKRNYVEWDNLEPYQISYTDNQRVVDLIENYSCLKQTELRICQLITDGARQIKVKDTLSSKDLNFTVTESIYNSRNPKEVKTKHLQWQTWDFEDEETE